MRAQLSKYFTKHYLRSLKPAVVIAIALFALILVLLATKTIYQYYSLSPAVVVENVVTGKILAKPGLPKQLIIPSINIDVTIDYVGLTPDGAMDIKPNPEVVGWYMLGARPGDEGSAVVAGHYGWGKNGNPAIFNDIQYLKKGDEISVIDQEGESFVFVVREIRKYSPEADASAVFQSSDGSSHLNLITCDGDWENDKQSYSERLVVFTDQK